MWVGPTDLAAMVANSKLTVQARNRIAVAHFLVNHFHHLSIPTSTSCSSLATVMFARPIIGGLSVATKGQPLSGSFQATRIERQGGILQPLTTKMSAA